MSPPLSLSDDELSAVMALARPVRVESRDNFLRSLADALAPYAADGALGPGVIYREGAKLQKIYVNVAVGQSKYR